MQALAEKYIDKPNSVCYKYITLDIYNKESRDEREIIVLFCFYIIDLVHRPFILAEDVFFRNSASSRLACLVPEGNLVTNSAWQITTHRRAHQR